MTLEYIFFFAMTLDYFYISIALPFLENYMHVTY